MGKQSNTTKSGKYINPADQERKRVRKQELKKNKKQRQLIRSTVLKGIDSQQILEEMEQVDQMECNIHGPPPLNEMVLKEKRRKLRDALEKVLCMYQKDEPEKYVDLKRRMVEYEQKKNELVCFYESVKMTLQVKLDEIPLPQEVDSIELTVPSLSEPVRAHLGCPSEYGVGTLTNIIEMETNWAAATDRVDRTKANVTHNMNYLKPHDMELPFFAPVQKTIPPPYVFEGDFRQPKFEPCIIRHAGPQLVHPYVKSANSSSSVPSKPQGTAITGEPQLRDLKADLTKFVPSVLMVKRKDRRPTKSIIAREMKQMESKMYKNASVGNAKDDAYKLFMKEMEQLM